MSVSTQGVATELSGWGRTVGSMAYLHRPASREQVAECISAAGPRGLGVRGGGRSCADAAQNAGGSTLILTGPLRTPAVVSVDWQHRIARLAGGATMAEVSRELLAQGWFLPIAGRTAHLSVGGAVACDLHGPSHYSLGSLAASTVSIELMDAEGNITTATPDGQDASTFWATFGAMGLTGIVLAIEVRVTAVSSAWLLADTTRCASLADVLETLAITSASYPYSSARLDTAATGRRRGRGVVSSARHAGVMSIPETRRPSALEFEFAHPARRPLRLPNPLVAKWTSRLAHHAWFASAPAARQGELQPAGAFFHCADSGGGWQGQDELLQYQFVVPDRSVDLIDEFLLAMQSLDVVSANATLLRFGDHQSGPLSFPLAGWSLALDLPASRYGLGKLLDDFDEKLASAGGRVFLASDTRLRRELLAAMYPDLPAWRAVRQTQDPNGRFTSDMSRRLGL